MSFARPEPDCTPAAHAAVAVFAGAFGFGGLRPAARVVVLGMLVGLCGAPLARADMLAGIGDGAGAGATGRVALNQAAGAGNAQSNLATIGGGAAWSRQAAGGAEASGSMRSTIEGQAFAGARGLISLNQASGAGNTQNNLALLSGRQEVQTVADSVLAATVSPRGPTAAGTSTGERLAAIGPHAFAGASGVVQVNQSAGLGNASGNVFVLQTPGLPAGSVSRSFP